mmetsp:Transcript_97790/g.232854  ORF Transcript_97790/g.232854 Transcript_97790/m.232854 type:complete len:247 (+) Transcript_97790:632-1372(+)
MLPVLVFHLVALRPGLEAAISVPVVAQAPNVLCRLLVSVCHSSTLQHTITVVVPNDDLRADPCSLEGWAQGVPHEVPLFLCGIDAGLPDLRRLRFILDCDGKNRHALLLHLLDEADEVMRPDLVAFPFQVPVAFELGLRLHPNRRTPRTRHQGQRPRDLHGIAHGGQNGGLVVVQAEPGQLLVTLRQLPAGPVSQPKVAGADGEPAQVVPQARLLVEASLQRLVPDWRRHLFERLAGSLREAAAEA